MEQLTVKNSNEEIFSQENIQNASALLALLHGKSDSICRIFQKEIIVSKEQIKTLNNLIIEKLKLHNVIAITTSIDVVFNNKKIITFKTFDEFVDYDFTIVNSATQSVFIQWDFFVKLNYTEPQRHTISVRMATNPKPSDLFKVLLNGGFDDADDISIQSASTICKVDFISNTLAEELINVVSQWNDLCESAISQKGKVRKFLYLHNNTFANICKICSIISICIVISIIIKILVISHCIDINKEFIIWGLLMIIPIGFFSEMVGKFFGKKLYDKFGTLMELHVFTLTKGDDKKHDKIKKRSSYCKELIMFSINTIVTILLSIIFFLID